MRTILPRTVLVKRKDAFKSGLVARWATTPCFAALLCLVLLVIAVVLVLPQVDLLDSVFLRGTGPIVVHSLATHHSLVRLTYSGVGPSHPEPPKVRLLPGFHLEASLGSSLLSLSLLHQAFRC